MNTRQAESRKDPETKLKELQERLRAEEQSKKELEEKKLKAKEKLIRRKAEEKEDNLTFSKEEMDETKASEQQDTFKRVIKEQSDLITRMKELITNATKEASTLITADVDQMKQKIEELNKIFCQSISTLDNFKNEEVTYNGSPNLELYNAKKNFKLDQNTPPFGGKDSKMKITDWIFCIERSFKVSGIPENLKLDVITPYLRGSAFRIAKRFIEDGNLNWDDFKKELSKLYLRIDEDTKLREELLYLKHTDSFEKYARKFQDLASQVNMQAEDKLTCFLHGLKPQTRTEIQLRKIDSYEEALVVAAQIENTRESNTHKVNFVSKFNNNKNVKKQSKETCFRCKKTGHIAKNCYVKIDNKSKNYNYNEKQAKKEDYRQHKETNNKEIICYACKKKGHKANNCRDRSKKMNYIKEENELTDEDRKDYLLTNMIHILNVGSERHNLVTIEGKINGIPMTIAFDSGATCSIISKDTAKKYDLKILDSTAKIKTADNIIKDVIGKIGKVDINIQGHKCELNEVIVIDHKDHDVLLGLDWFHLTGAGVFPGSGVIQFPGNNKEVSVEEDDFTINLLEIADDEEYAPDMNWHLKCDSKQNGGRKFINIKGNNSKLENMLNDLDKMIDETCAKTIKDLSVCTVREHKIHLKENVIINLPNFRRSLQERELLKKEINAMLEAGVIRKSKSEFSSPAFLVPKKDGS